MNKQRIDQLSVAFTDIYLELETDLLVNIAEKLAEADIDDINTWSIEVQNNLATLSNSNRELIINKQAGVERKLLETIEKAGFESVDEFEDFLSEQAEKGRLNTAPPIRESNQLASIITTVLEEAKERVNTVNTTMLQQSEQAYLDIVNRVTNEVTVGLKTPQEALRQVASEWADIGIPALIDKRGRKWSTEAYVNMITRTQVNNVANAMQDARFNEYGVDLVEVSSHAGSRELCYPHQGKIYSVSGNSRRFPPLSETSIGQPAGLFGVNCGHVKYPYVEGVSKKTNIRYNGEENNRIYKESQQQRYIERQIRKSKREQSMLEALGDNDGVAIAKQKVRAQQKNMREFIDKTDRTRRRNREQIV